MTDERVRRDLDSDGLVAIFAGAYADSTVLPARVPGYAGTAEAPENAPYVSMTQPHAAGALMSTAIDVDRWQRALHGGELLGEDFYESMISSEFRSIRTRVASAPVPGSTVRCSLDPECPFQLRGMGLRYSLLFQP